jgi:hypothetical protein
LAVELEAHGPDSVAVEKLWRRQFPDTTRWRLRSAFKRDLHFSLVVLARCEIQAIDQHWSLHRLAISLDGEPDDSLAREFSFARVDPELGAAATWPTAEPARWRTFVSAALEAEVAAELAAVRARQESYLRRELDRIDAYFANYEHELSARANRSASSSVKVKATDRLAAAKAEHARRRADQVTRHEIRIRPHLDALMLVAEPAWRGSLEVERAHLAQAVEPLFVPRARKWFV